MRKQRFSLVAATIASAAAFTVAGVGSADAAWSVEPGKFAHTESLTNGELTVTVTNTTAIPASCALSVYKGSDAGAVANMTSVMNKYYGGDASASDIAAARAQISGAQLKDLTADSTIPAGGNRDYTWKSGRSDTSYTVLQNCAANDEAGTLISGASSYLVTGTGAGSVVPGTGSLGSLLP